MASIEFKQVTKAFDKTVVIDNLNLKIEDGKFTVLVGPSGCGKTTLLRMAAGIGPQTSGQVIIGEQDVTDVAPGQRGVAMVFQNYAIYPTMSVRENVEFGLKNNKIPKAQRELLIADVSAKVGLENLLERMPATLSGGQRQRVALARAMVKKPSVFLMDEPLSNLDAKLRVQMRVELIELHQKLKTTSVYVTHDQTEAMSMGDVIILMEGGVIQQMASPSVIYKDPDNKFTAGFIGSPSMNFWRLTPGDVWVGFRPEHAVISPAPTGQYVDYPGVVSTREMLGSETIYKVAVEGGRECMVKQMTDDYFVGDQIHLGIPADKIYLFAREGQRIRREDNGFAEAMAGVKEGVFHEEKGTH